MAILQGKTPRAPEAQKAPPAIRPIAGPLELIDLDAEAKQLRMQPAWHAHGQSAKTLVKHEHFRVVLIALRAGRRCQEHRAEESLSVQTLDGDLKVHLAAGDVIELRAGYLLALAPTLAHDLEAFEDSTVLLSMVWTGHRKDHPTGARPA